MSFAVFQVGDFGLSRIKRNTLVSGGVRGTLPWMAPELLDSTSSKVSEKVTKKNEDLYFFSTKSSCVNVAILEENQKAYF